MMNNYILTKTKNYKLQYIMKGLLMYGYLHAHFQLILQVIKL